MKPYPSMRFLDAVLVLALAARIHHNDAQVRRVAMHCLERVETGRRGWIETITRMESPCRYMEAFILTIPDHILSMKSEPVVRLVQDGIKT